MFSWKEATCELCPVLLNERKLFLSSPFHWEERNRKSKKRKRKICVNGYDCWMAGWSKSKTMTCWWNFEKEREPLGFAL
jgi:hypothetical protein